MFYWQPDGLPTGELINATASSKHLMVVFTERETMLKNSKVVSILTLQSWSGHKLLAPHHLHAHSGEECHEICPD
jgi:hypothetical protein